MKYGLRSTVFACVGVIVAGCASAGGRTADRLESQKPWSLQQLLGSSVAGYPGTAFLKFEDGTHMSGSGGCLPLIGEYARSGNDLKFSQLESRFSGGAGACAKYNSQQRDFVIALRGTRSYRIEKNQLYLLSDSATTLAVLTMM